MEVFKEFSFEAAHRLPHVPPGHKCGRLHGHSFRVEIGVSGPMNQHSGWVTDFATIQTAFEPLLKELDHNYLNDVEGLENPTSESIAIWIWDRLSPMLKGLCSITVHETCTCRARYQGRTQ